VTIAELRPGLRRWTARHPGAVDDPVPGSPADWAPDVGCVDGGRTVPVRRAGEVMVWLEEHRPLVPGDWLLAAA
jgi:hypothetical protein